MSTSQIELTATISRVTYRGANGWIAVAINAEGFVSAAGKFAGSGALERGTRCRLRGIPSTYRNKPALKLTAATILERDLHDPFMVEARHAFPGFTRRHERSLRETLGVDWAASLTATPALIEQAAFTRWNAETREGVVKAAAKIVTMSMLRKDLLTIGLKERAIIEIVASISENGEALAHQGMDASTLILKGYLTFTQAEDANKLGNFFHSHIDRRTAAIWGEALTALNDDGCSAVTVADMQARLSTQYAFGSDDIRQALDKHEGVELVGKRDPAIALPGAARCERDLLKIVKKLRASPLRRRSTAREIDARFQGLQREAIETILTNRICAVTGGPGTGKTTICAEVASQLKDVLGIALAARAARNLSDRSGAPAMTIQRFLNMAERNGAIQPYRALIVDEASMIGSKQLWEILRIAERAGVKRVVLIGDADQLPPIDWGRPFADLIEGDAFPIVRLTENKRTDADGGIARLASDMRRGLSPYPSFATYDHVTLTDVCNPEEALYRVQRAYMRLREGGASFSEIAVLSPYRDPKFVLSSERLNRAIRQSLGMAAGKASVGEIVIATQNDYENNAINGVRGVVKTSDENGLTVQFEGANDIAFYGSDELGENGLPEGVAWGYAYSVHKAQGSEFRHVIVVVSEEMARLFGKPALYTAVTRARESLAIIGDLFSLPAIIAAPDRRFTVLGALFGESAHPTAPDPCPDYDAYFRAIAMDKREVAFAD